MAVRRKRATKKSNGHPFLVLLFFISLVVGSAYMTDRMTNAPTADNADQVTAIRHIFNDKEMQGLVPKEDQGTPESVKEKIKDIINKTVVVEAKADDEDTPKAVEVTKADGKTERMKEDEARETEPAKEVFSISRVVSKITGKEEPKAETPTETVVASASSERTESADSRERTSAPAPSSVKKTEPAKAAPAKSGKSEARANGSSEKALPAKAAFILPPKENAGGQVTGRLAIVIDDAGHLICMAQFDNILCFRHKCVMFQSLFPDLYHGGTTPQACLYLGIQGAVPYPCPVCHRIQQHGFFYRFFFIEFQCSFLHSMYPHPSG